MHYILTYSEFLTESTEEREIEYILENSLLHVGLDLIGVIPGFGEFADAANAILYIKKGAWLFAGLSILALIPELGDLLGKSAKFGVWVDKLAKTGKAGKHTIKIVGNIARQVRMVKNWLSMNFHLVEQLFEAIRNGTGRTEAKIKPYLPKIEKALGAFLQDKEQAKSLDVS